MDILKEVLMKLKELQALVGGAAEDAPDMMAEEQMVSKPNQQEEDESDRAPTLSPMEEAAEAPIGRGPISFKEKVSQFNKNKRS